MEGPYHTIRKKDTQALAHFLTKNGQALLPMVPGRKRKCEECEVGPRPTLR